MIKKQVVKEVTCTSCGDTFQLGYNGVLVQERPMCDRCAGVIRAKNGHAVLPDDVRTGAVGQALPVGGQS